MTFRDLHYADEPLLLPNAWDVSAALAFHDAGYRAVGTSSFGLAAADGRPDAGPSLPFRAAIHPAITVADNVRNGVSPPAASSHPKMQARLVDFAGPNEAL